MNRQETLSALREQPNVSVVVVGGGVNGIGTFRDLARQGVDVLLVEKNDFSSGASAASSHMVHGGLRYLENAEFRLVREALTERNRLLKNAPHYVHPLPTTIPIFKWLSGALNAPLKFLGWSSKPAERGAFIIKVGLMMYDAFASIGKSMPNHHFMSQDKSLARFPGLNPEIIATATYYDAWMPYPERICIELITDAEQNNPNARAMNYVSAAGGGGDTLTLKDELTGETFDVKPHLVINAAGPWIDHANKNMSRETNFIGGTKGSHLVVEHDELHAALGGHEIFFENKDGRICLIFPLEDRVLMGTTDIRLDNPDAAVATEDEVDYILALVDEVFPDLKVTREHVVFTFSGVRPLPSQDAATTGQISRDHSIRTLEAGNGTDYPIFSLVGGKWTTFRAFSEQTADVALDRLDMPRQVSTADMAFGGGVNYPTSEADQRRFIVSLVADYGIEEDYAAALFDRYGTDARNIAAYCAKGDNAPLTNKPDYTRREVEFICEREKVARLDDFVLRRSLLAMLGKLTPALLSELAEIVGETLGWSKQQRADEAARCIELLEKKYRTQLHEGKSSTLAPMPAADPEEADEAEATPEPVAGD